ncbi:unnamed protein product [Kluyveromyces dobzhanskii CBS 2104]|uniref:E3 SUMO-protein transferase SIZ2 n=1 Tax=Kluyveromyces dobzhanskii CBS 2104 TaxID=1427455 RepID=A0A0A8L8N0_9SACH|nr:unnamed protein product [Kluyveromyces dobzhanskii CBS 2104]
MQHLLDDTSIDSVKEEIMLLKVAELKNVCRSIGLPISGRKMELQDRLTSFLMAPSRAGINDPFRIPAVNILVKKSSAGDPVPKFETLLHALTTGSFMHPVATGHQDVSALVPNNRIAGRPHLRFQPSPFFNLKRLIGSEAAPEAPSKRGVANISFKLGEEEITLLKSSSKIKLYLFCGINNSFGASNDVPVQFPLRNEIKFNGIQIKDNVHGLKNKIGTAKPADLTPYIQWPPKSNLLQVVYAFTKDDHIVYVYLVELIETEELLEKTLSRPKIVKPATLQYIKETLSEEEDDDLITTSTVMSLQCPISYSRMKYPVKSIHCRHLQCFDAQWFIESQRQIPTWQCPVCQKPINVEDLAICDFVQEIIKSTHEEVEQVEISKDGSWVEKDETDNHNQSSNGPPPAKQEETPDIKPEDSHTLQSNPEQPASEQVVISLDSDEEEEVEQATSKTTVPNGGSNSENMETSSTSTDVNQDNDLLDDEDMAFIEELANSIIERGPRRSQDDRNVTNMSQLNVSEPGIPNSSNPVRGRGTSLDPRTSGLLNHEADHPATARQLNIGSSSPNVDNYPRPAIPNLLGKAPLNSNPRAQEPQLPNVSQLTNADSILFTGNRTSRSLAPPEMSPDANVGNIPQPRSSSINGLSNDGPTATSTAAPGGSQPTNPVLPPLPPIPARSNSYTTAPSLPQPPPIPDPRRRKPEVSPFLPRKNYKNVLPKKRAHPNGSTTNGDTQSNSSQSANSTPTLSASMHLPPTTAEPAANGVASPNDSLNSDDLIDLTSD